MIYSPTFFPVNLELIVKLIRKRTRMKHSSEDKIRIVLEELKGEDDIASLS